MATATTKRLLKELASFDENPALTYLRPVSDDLFTWEAELIGPTDSPYQNGKWLLKIDIPSEYPLRPPSIRFVTKICHPNIKFETGEICLDILTSQWSPAWTLSSSMTAIQAMLTSPEPDSPLNVDAANLLRCGDISAYNGLIKYYTVLYGR